MEHHDKNIQREVLYKHNNVDCIMSDISGNEIRSVAPSRRDESISSKLEKLVKSEKTIKDKIDEFDKKYRQPSGDSNVNMYFDAHYPKDSHQTSHDNSELHVMMMKSKNLRKPSPGEKSSEKKRRDGKYPNYLEVGITSSSKSKKRPEISELSEKGGRDDSRRHNEEIDQDEYEVSRRGMEVIQRQDYPTTIPEELSKETPDSKSRHYSTFNSTSGVKLLPRVINMNLNTYAKSIENTYGPSKYD